jgi:hypothetical protein
MINTIKKLQRELSKEKYDETKAHVVVRDKAGTEYTIEKLRLVTYTVNDKDTKTLVIELNG